MGSTALLPLPASAAPSGDAVAEAVRRLTAGEVVGLPTETVYGLVARADLPEARARLVAAKRRSASQPLTLLAATRTVLEGAALPHLLARVSERYWPGPLTLVVRAPGGDGPAHDALELAAVDGWAGVRVPAHDGARAVLAAAPFPVLSTSANRHGTPPATEASAVRATFTEAEVPLVLDGGRAPLEQSSTVAAIGPGRFEVLREGIVSAEELARVAGLRILFVCTGNTCRSPMAEGLARTALASALEVEAAGLAAFGFDIRSAGVFASPGAPASRQAVEVLKRRGIDLSGHESSAAIDRSILAADRVYCLTASHRSALLEALPPGRGAHVELLDQDGGDVPDPYGGPLEQYAATADALEPMIARRLREDWV